MPSPGLSGSPRFDKHQKRLSCFFEPLFLLDTLGSTRGDRSNGEEAHGIALNSTIQTLRRAFLSNLAYICDFDKGGSTVTAIGLESVPERQVYWVASNSGETWRKIIPFLQGILARLSDASTSEETFSTEQVDGLAEDCIAFARPRIKKYRSHLKIPLQRILKFLSESNGQEEDLILWLQTWSSKNNHVDLCRSAYFQRKSDFMRSLEKLGAESAWKSSQDSIRLAFQSVRHYIGRLGHHFRVAHELFRSAHRLAHLLADFEVLCVPTVPMCCIPPPDKKTRLDSILVRMLPAASPELRLYQEALSDMDAKFDLTKRLLAKYDDRKSNPCIHAEIQVLEHFYKFDKSFEADDRHIACSKPACFCCLLYFRHHPWHVAEPPSHHKIYLNWRPPHLIGEGSKISEHHQRDLLINMSKDIRKQALQQISERAPHRHWHPDSITGITESLKHAHVTEPLRYPIEATLERRSNWDLSPGSASATDDSAEYQYGSSEDEDEEGGVPL